MARSSSPICIRGYFFFSSHPPPRGALELELRRCCHTGGLQQSVDTVTSHFPIISAGNIRRSHGRDGGQRDWSRPTIDYSKPVFHSSRITSIRIQCRSWRLTSASNLPRGRREDSEARPTHRWPRRSSTTELYPEGSQFADNVNSHPASLMATHTRIQTAKGAKERFSGHNDSPPR